MHSREHLERFREAAEATGVGLGFPKWRFTVELGSKLFEELKGEIPAQRLEAIRMEIAHGAWQKEKEGEQTLQQNVALMQELAIKTGIKLKFPDFLGPSSASSSMSSSSTSSVEHAADPEKQPDSMNTPLKTSIKVEEKSAKPSLSSHLEDYADQDHSEGEEQDHPFPIPKFPTKKKKSVFIP